MKKIVVLILAGIALFCSIFDCVSLPFDAAWIAILLCGVPIIVEASIGLVTAFDIKADVLVSLALIASVCIGEYFAAGEIAFIMQIGSFLEEFTVSKAQAGIEKLVKLTPRIARVLEDHQEKMIPAEDVKVGDRIRVLPGETVPVDGVIVSGETSLNQSVMTGESMPVDKSVGDEVFSGTINQFGIFEMKATKVGEDSSIQRMIQLVKHADAGKAEIVSLADRWATWVVVIALLAAGVTWIFSGEVIRAVTILVVFCPCSFILATPTAIMAGIGNASRNGFLVREGDALERLAKVSKICFDKTGTLTQGIPKVIAVKTLHNTFSTEEMYRLVAIAERSSEHPLGKALVASYQNEHTQEVEIPTDFHMIPGKGIKAIVEEKEVLVGNLKMMCDHNIHVEPFQTEQEQYLKVGCTVLYVAIDGTATGLIAMSDMLRDGMEKTMQQIFWMGICPVLLTGDHKSAAETIANHLHITKVVADCLPEHKLQYMEKAQEMGHKVCMIGDGINDAPALKKAYVGIAMGNIGSDIAVEAADLVLVDDKIEKLPHIFALSKRMMRTIRWNLVFSMGLNFVAIFLAMYGALNPVVGALVHNCGSVLVILHSTWLLHWKENS